jgi:hypothetical protein
MYIFNQRLLQYPEDRPTQNCVNMYGGLMAPLANPQKRPTAAPDHVPDHRPISPIAHTGACCPYRMLEDVAFTQIVPGVFINRTVTYVYVASQPYIMH